ncbi:MAG: FlgD immunoglobulin-like domain containing protein [Candidatus Celaenobacter antarcticus]|nr:FlgD immunoglobulin-like domain containing protein [Candidatus Celaenobacter antarcticus]
MKKIIIFSLIYLMFVGFIWTQDIPQPINNKAIIPLTAPEHLKVTSSKRCNDRPYFHEWEFIQEPTTLTGFTNYYDYMPGSFCGRALMRQPDAFGGVYFVFHGRPNTAADRRVYCAYVHPDGSIEYGTITTSSTWQGYPSMTMHPASGDPIVTWHDIMGASTPEDTNTRATFDDYGLLYIPGFWKTPVTFDQPTPYVDEYLWPYMYIGMSPDYATTGNYRVYQISDQNPDGEIEHSILRWIDVPQDSYVYGDLDIILDKNNWSGPVNICRDWSDPAAGIDCRPYPSFAVDPFNAGHVALFGYAGYVNGLTGNEIVPQGFYVWDSYDGGETWSYDNFHSYETDVGMLNEYVLYAVENVPGFTDDEGNPFDSLHVWVGFPGNNCSNNRTAVFDSEGNIHLPELFWISYVDGDAGSITYWPEYAFLFQAEVVYKADGTWDIRHVANMPGTDAWTGLSVPWKIDTVNGDTLIYPWCDIASNDYSPSGYGNFQHQAVCLENNWMAQVWVSGTKMLCTEQTNHPIPGYEDYYHHPIIHIAISNSNGYYWYDPIELSDIYSTAFPEFADMITVYPYVDPIIKDLGDGWGQIDMYFFDDNDYGSYIQGVGDNTGGQMVYCSIKFYHYAPPSTDPSNPEAESLLNIHNAPNPFFSETQIQFSTSVGVENAKVAIYNIRGQLIKTIDPVTESHTEGHATWDGTDQNGNNVTNGIYFYRVETNGASIAKKMIVIK